MSTLILPAKEANTSNMGQALDIAKNKGKSTNFAHAQKVWKHKEIIIENVFAFTIASDLIDDDIQP